MSTIGRDFGDQPAPPVIPFPHQTGVAGESFRGRQFLRLMFLPETLFASKCGYAALGGYAGACEYYDAGGRSDPFAGLFHRPIMLKSTKSFP